MKFMKFLKAILAFIICILPNNKIKCLLINFIPGYKFKNVKLGYFNFFFVDKINVSNSLIGNFNYFNISVVSLDNDSRIGSRNIFLSKNINDDHELKMSKSQVSFDNYFEFGDNIFLGENVVFGGKNSKIIFKERGKTLLKKNIFIGSNSILMSGIYISENVIIGAGSYVYKDINATGLYFSKKLLSKNI